MSEPDLENPFSEPVEIEITDSIDLHSFQPRDVRAVVEAYLDEARKKGFRLVRIIHGKANGVKMKSGEFLAADAVVSNADVAWTYLNLIPNKFRRKNTDKKVKSLEYSMSLFVIYFGTNRKYENMAHHEIIMGKRYRSLLEDIPNLYFVGAGTHPGAGLPGVISSGKIVGNMIGKQ